MKNKTAIIGSNGQLGSDLSKIYGEDAVNLTRKEIEVTDFSMCRKVLGKINPDVVINCAAYVKVDDAEIYPLEAFSVNSIGAKNIAMVSEELNSTNVYISTDYVFDGRKGTPYTEDDLPNPINVYGMSKYLGECLTQCYSRKYYIFRVSSLFGKAGSSGKGGNFIETMISTAERNEEIKVVDDIFMSPTYTKDAAFLIKSLIEKNPEFGIYHLNNSGQCSWYEFATEIFKIMNLNPDIQKIDSKDLDRKAERPIFSALNNQKLQKLGVCPKDWKSGLISHLQGEDYL
ncbi:MAG: dTDP-4-dehydrorhamnose reductase [Candidatus Methanofastidiosum sp.]|nr:dTDP-4-dehydrorhamnose reductase [Methanofastidiosum sp.]